MLLLALLSALAWLNGCALTQQAGETMAAWTRLAKGEYYLNQGKYQEGIAAFETEVDRRPLQAVNYYYLGRFHLAHQQNPPDR